MQVIPCTKEHVERGARILADEYFPGLQQARTFLEENMNKNTCYVCLEGEEVIGLFAYWKDYSHYANYLTDIVVAKSHRRKGVARALMDKYVAICREEQPRRQPYALSSTDETNKTSIKMHEQYGFERLGTIKRLHYGKDEIIYGYKLF